MRRGSTGSQYAESHNAMRRYRPLGFSEIIRKEETVIMETGTYLQAVRHDDR